MEKKNETPPYPKTDWHGDYLAYLGQKSQSHYVSKVDLKQWHKDLKVFSLSSLIFDFEQNVNDGNVESGCNNASLVFTSLLFKPQWEHGHPTYL